MDLQQFITTAIKAIGKGIEEGREGNIIPGNVTSSTQSNGAEFDLAIQFTDKEIRVVGEQTKDYPVLSRIKFSIPITISRE